MGKLHNPHSQTEVDHANGEEVPKGIPPVPSAGDEQMKGVKTGAVQSRHRRKSVALVGRKLGRRIELKKMRKNVKVIDAYLRWLVQISPLVVVVIAVVVAEHVVDVVVSVVAAIA